MARRRYRNPDRGVLGLGLSLSQLALVGGGAAAAYYVVKKTRAVPQCCGGRAESVLCELIAAKDRDGYARAKGIQYGNGAVRVVVEIRRANRDCLGGVCLPKIDGMVVESEGIVHDYTQPVPCTDRACAAVMPPSMYEAVVLVPAGKLCDLVQEASKYGDVRIRVYVPPPPGPPPNGRLNGR